MRSSSASVLAAARTARWATYAWWLRRVIAAAREVTPLAVRAFFASLQDHSPSHQHQAYRTLKTFFRWCVETGVLAENPLRGFTMRMPKMLPDVPTEDELRAVLDTCGPSSKSVTHK